MVHIGFADEGIPDYPLEKLDNGLVVPDASIADIQRSHRQRLRDRVETAKEADDLGYDYLVYPEHHFHLLAPIAPNPVLMHAAVAQQTDDVRLLQLANILPWYEPVRLAEQLAMVDVLSDGRVDVGVGRGSGGLESYVLGQYWGGSATDKTMHFQSFEEKCEILVEAWTEDFVTHHGQFHDVPPSYTEREHNQEYAYLADDRSEYGPSDYMQVQGGTTTLKSVPVFPKPEQSPHPQLWTPVGSPPTIKWAARRGMNAGVHGNTFDDVAEWIEIYYDAAEDAGWPDHRPEHDGDPFRYGWDERRRRGVAPLVHVFNTEVADDETFERWKLGQEFLQTNNKALLPPGRAEQVEIDAQKELDGETPIVGDTEEIIDQLATFRDVCGYEDFVLFPQFKIFGMTHEETLAQMRSFAEDVRPYFEEEEATTA